jgi:hypothetical protein
LPAAFNGSSFFYAGTSPTAELRQDVDVSAYAATINASQQQFAFDGWVRSGNKNPADTARIVIEYRDSTNSTVLAAADSGQVSSTQEWLELKDQRTAPAGTAVIRVRLIATRNSGTTNDAYFDEITLRPVGAAGVHLTGIVTDDGLPAGGKLTSSWGVSSGPGSAVFGDATNPITTATLESAGTYVLALAANDGQLTTTGTMQVTVTRSNQAPVVNAGQNQTINAAAAQLQGSVQDDGLPVAAVVTLNWTLVSGPRRFQRRSASGNAGTDGSQKLVCVEQAGTRSIPDCESKVHPDSLRFVGSL